MSKNLRRLMTAVICGLVVLSAVYYVSHHVFAVLSPAGSVAQAQRHLIILATLLMLLIVVPVFGLTGYIVWKYRASNTQATYSPDWDHSRLLESIWWGFPCAIILVLAIVTWNSSHQLDPAKALVSDQQPLTVQVIALDWKWLFLYPEQGIASVNYLRLPVNRPVNFEITSDAPMNSFWIPQLGGQIYAMAGMTTQLHLMADKVGSYHGASANLSGAGFSSMQFVAQATNSQNFDDWVLAAQSHQTTTARLTTSAYDTLARPSIPKSPQLYTSYDHSVYDRVMMKYMSLPANVTTTTQSSGRQSDTIPTGMTMEMTR